MKTSTTNSAAAKASVKKVSSAASMNFFKVVFFTVFIILSVGKTFSQDWAKLYGTQGIDIGNCVAIDHAGNVYVTGLSNYSANMRCTLLKYSSTGNLIWERTFLGVGSGYGKGEKLLIDPQGNIFVFASIYGFSQNYDFYIIKYDQSGNEISSARYGDVSADEDIADAAFDNNGNIVVAVNAWTISNGQTDIFLLKYNNMCVVQSFAAFAHSTWYESAGKIVINGLGDIFMAGSVRVSGGNSDVLVAKFNSQLQYQNVYMYAGYVNDEDYAASICLHPAGGVIIAGMTKNTSVSSDFTIIKLSNNLTYEWMNANNFQFAGSNASDVTIAGSRIYATGTAGTGYISKALTVAYDFNGNIIWSHAYGRDTVSNGGNAGFCIKTDNIGNVFVAGKSVSLATKEDAMILKYSSAGVLQFAYNYNGSAFEMDYFNSLITDSNGKIYACGFTFVGTNNCDFITVKLTGSLTGVNGTNNEIPDGFNLSQNYPNPFNPSTKISFSLPKASFVKMVVYDITGKEVEVLVNENMNAGSFEVDFNASKLTSGVYFYRITADGFTETNKMILTK